MELLLPSPRGVVEPTRSFPRTGVRVRWHTGNPATQVSSPPWRPESSQGSVTTHSCLRTELTSLQLLRVELHEPVPCAPALKHTVRLPGVAGPHPKPQ